MNIDYYHKYIKYKTKYLKLDNNQIGGARTNNSRSDKYYKLSTKLSYLSDGQVNDFINVKKVKALELLKL
jgi:lipase chaperone LimK